MFFTLFLIKISTFVLLVLIKDQKNDTIRTKTFFKIPSFDC